MILLGSIERAQLQSLLSQQLGRLRRLEYIRERAVAEKKRLSVVSNPGSEDGNHRASQEVRFQVRGRCRFRERRCGGTVSPVSPNDTLVLEAEQHEQVTMTPKNEERSTTYLNSNITTDWQLRQNKKQSPDAQSFLSAAVV